MTSTFKKGQRIFVRCRALNGAEVLESARIVRPEPMKRYATGEDYPGWYIVKYDDGNRMCAHQDGFVAAGA